MKRRAGVLAAVCLWAGCAAKPPVLFNQSSAAPSPAASTASTQPAVPPDALAARIDALLAGPEITRGTWGVEVVSLDRGTTLYASRGDKLLMPASAMKVITLAAAASQLGWNYAFTTRLLAAGAIQSGTLNGDLWVVGSGDPSIDDWDGAATALFRAWSDRLKEMGIRTIAGDIVGDDDGFEDEDALGAGWAWDDLAAGYATSVGALQFNQNTAQLIVTPGEQPGTAATVVLSPAYAPVEVRSLATTGPAGSATSLAIRPVPRTGAVELRGSIPARSGAAVRNISVANPTQYFVNALRDALVRDGIDVRGRALDVDERTVPSVRPSEIVVTEAAHGTLGGIAPTMMRLSQNLFAESVLKALGRSEAGIGTARDGRTAVLRTLAAWGIAPDEVLMADGSGLSRYNVVTPHALVRVLSAVFAEPRLRDTFIETLPAPGADGTLSRRLKGTPAETSLRAKTGSFSNARALAGYLRTADREPLAFAIIANNFAVPPEVVDRVTDAIVLELAQFSRR